MCGIMGCIGSDAVGEVYRGLVRLEYRGYDSAGISSLVHGRICTAKRAGMVSGLKGELTRLGGEVAIGHTRWATHGAPTDANAHPHTVGKFSIVHNGIIENYAELSEKLLPQAAFKSQTDSEIVAHLLNRYYGGDFLRAVADTVNRLRGAFALAILCADCPCIAVARWRNPVVVGRGGGRIFVSSDMAALAGVADSACVLKDGQIALCGSGGISLFGFDLKPVPAEYVPVCAESTSACRGGYAHYMLKEINEIPAAVENTLSAMDEPCRERLAGLRGGFGRIILTGCGTAYHSALAAAYAIEELAGVPARAEAAGELRYRNYCADGALLVAVSQSGETADTLEAARSAKQRGMKVVAVTNAPYSALNSMADAVVPVCAGAEVSVAATKSYCGQLAALISLAALWGGRQIDGLTCIARQCAHIIRRADALALAQLYVQSGGVYFIGRGMDYPTALEGSLKLKEVSYIAGEGYPACELKHGPLALIDGSTLTVAIVTDRALANKTASSLEEIMARGGRTAVIAAKDCLLPQFKRAQLCIEIPACCKYLAPILSAVPLQLAAYHAAVLRGNNPDRPRNLAKSVTVE